MSVGRITMIEWTSDEAMQSAFSLYLSTQKEYFPKKPLPEYDLPKKAKPTPVIQQEIIDEVSRMSKPSQAFRIKA